MVAVLKGSLGKSDRMLRWERCCWRSEAFRGDDDRFPGGEEKKGRRRGGGGPFYACGPELAGELAVVVNLRGRCDLSSSAGFHPFLPVRKEEEEMHAGRRGCSPTHHAPRAVRWQSDTESIAVARQISRCGGGATSSLASSVSETGLRSPVRPRSPLPSATALPLAIPFWRSGPSAALPCEERTRPTGGPASKMILGCLHRPRRAPLVCMSVVDIG